MRIDFAKELESEKLPKPDPEKYEELRKTLATKRGIAFVATARHWNNRLVGQQEEEENPYPAAVHAAGANARRHADLGCALCHQGDYGRQPFQNVPLTLASNGEMAGIAMYAALFEPDIAGITVRGLPASHRNRPDILNVLRYLDLPQVVAMAAEHSHVRIEQSNDADWEYPLAVSQQLGWTKGIEIVRATDSTEAQSEVRMNSTALKLHTGDELPAVGFGLWKVDTLEARHLWKRRHDAAIGISTAQATMGTRRKSALG